MKKNYRMASGFWMLSVLFLGSLWPTPEKHPPQFTPPDVLTVSDIPYPATVIAAGVVTLAVELDGTGKVQNIQRYRDIPSVTTQASLALQGWTYLPATLNGKPVASTLIVNIVFDPAFLDTNNIPLAPPDVTLPAKSKAPVYTPPQLFTATFPPYPANGQGSGAVVLDVTVNSTGNITQVNPVRDVPTLTAAAVNAMKNWSFSAAIYGNAPITSKVIVAMVFRNPATALP